MSTAIADSPIDLDSVKSTSLSNPQLTYVVLNNNGRLAITAYRVSVSDMRANGWFKEKKPVAIFVEGKEVKF